MIRFVSGTIAESNPGHVIVETGTGLGYLVAVSARTALLPGDTVRLFTHLAVRETALDLYGFTSTIELQMFELLLTLSGIGPKSALAILDQADVTTLAEAISTEDPAFLTKTTGIGKKTAEKIVLGLKDKIANIPVLVTPTTYTSDYQDAFDTLLALGYAPQQIRPVLDSLPTDATTSTYVTLALKQLS